MPTLWKALHLATSTHYIFYLIITFKYFITKHAVECLLCAKYYV